MWCEGGSSRYGGDLTRLQFVVIAVTGLLEKFQASFVDAC